MGKEKESPPNNFKTILYHSPPDSNHIQMIISIKYYSFIHSIFFLILPYSLSFLLFLIIFLISIWTVLGKLGTQLPELQNKDSFYKFRHFSFTLETPKIHISLFLSFYTILFYFSKSEYYFSSFKILDFIYSSVLSNTAIYFNDEIHANGENLKTL
jgi:hypothetical protein